MEGNGWYVFFFVPLLLLGIESRCLFLGKYVGNRPIKLKKADNAVNPVEIGHRKARTLEKELKKNRHKPY